MNLPKLYAVVDYETATRHGWQVCDLARAYLSAGARLLQVRAPHAAGEEYLAWCDEIVADASAVDALVIVNDRPDIAAMTKAAGVHLGQSDLAPEDARGILPEGALIGLSTHTSRQIDLSQDAPIDYVAIGPIYPTKTKDISCTEVGLDLVAYAARLRPERPIVGIGGITLDRARAVIDRGATSVAVVSDLLRGSDPARRTSEYVQLFGEVSK